ncbi:FAD:protein FMN transferase [Engelhardtia mirabilis]|uniref:FAD:protein FMN transferase n=1 Tax=Engelhardtia mirabilis TaxID=2528011 RepID=A0A518BNL3_9BACT|nr:Thiamine biosynthesis lipoprotein ApbE precursor [Planctomycetes bacterium Pla133]QDV02897.1 Thiamine biosynthesis lipoprotein ApbE precursor [Planctomycetes bacterium Pla86]
MILRGPARRRLARWGLGLVAVVSAACAGPAGVHRSLAPAGEVAVQAGGSQEPAVSEPAAADGLILRERRGGVMGTTFMLEALGADAERLDAALDAAEAELRRIEDLMTTWRTSPLTELNARSGQGPVVVERELAQIIDQSLRVAEATGGAFDPTWYSAGKLWDFKAPVPTIPAGEDIATALEHVGYGRVKVDLAASTVELEAGTVLGLGGIAKGYGVDRALAVLREHGIEHGMVDAGGDLRVIGRKHGEVWQIAVRHPRRRGDVLAVIPLANIAVVTSGDYERFFELDGVRYHHILDPRTGRPATGAMSATVIGPEAGLCDALATALCVMGPEQGLELIERMERVEALIVDLNGEMHLSSGLPRADERP